MDTVELHSLPSAEKLRIIELLWDDLASEGADFASPSWHAEELRKTADEHEAGRLEALDWQAAKEELRNRFK